MCGSPWEDIGVLAIYASLTCSMSRGDEHPGRFIYLRHALVTVILWPCS